MNLLQNIFSTFKTPAIALAGKWKGQYGYGKQYPEVTRKKIVRFTATIAGENDRFHGTITEDEENGIPEISKIDGAQKGGRILFNKTYSKSYSLDESGNRIVETRYGSQNVIYSGVYDHAKNKFHGTWRIEATFIFGDGKKRKHVSQGVWEMSKSE